MQNGILQVCFLPNNFSLVKNGEFGCGRRLYSAKVCLNTFKLSMFFTEP